jgi:hypothetical protein
LEKPAEIILPYLLRQKFPQNVVTCIPKYTVLHPRKQHENWKSGIKTYLRNICPEDVAGLNWHTVVSDGRRQY